jgi:hypothetical protein
MIMASGEYELIYLQAAMRLLESYLLAQDLYWPIGVKAPVGNPPYPQLTLGNLLYHLKRLRAYTLNMNQQAELTQIERQLYTIQTHWRVAWEQKAEREFGARLRLWRDFLEEYRDNPANHVDRYPYEVIRRVLLDLLAPQAAKISPAEAELLAGLDKLLFARFIPGDFIWDPQLSQSFPQQPYWYLYGNLKAE